MQLSRILPERKVIVPEKIALTTSKNLESFGCGVCFRSGSAVPAAESRRAHAVNASVEEAAVVIRTGGKAEADSAAAHKISSSRKRWSAYASKNGAGAADK